MPARSDEPTADDVILDLLVDGVTPTHANLTAVIAAYPQHRAALVEFFTNLAVQTAMQDGRPYMNANEIVIRFVGYPITDISDDLVSIGEGGGWAQHCEALTPDGFLLGAKPEGGVQKRPRDYDAGTFSRELYVPIETPIISFDDNITPSAMAGIFYSYLETKVGAPYNWTAIADIALEQNWKGNGGDICSQLMTLGLRDCGYFPRLYVTSNRITPRDLLLMLSCRQYISDHTPPKG